MKSLSLTAIQGEVEDLCHNGHDVVTSMSKVSMQPIGSFSDPDRLHITGLPWWTADGAGVYAMSHRAREGLLSRINFPSKFWDFLPTKNLRQSRDGIANNLLKQSKRDTMIRMNGQEVYGILSPAYERINHDWVIDQLWENEVASDFHITDFRADRDRLVLKARQKSMREVGDYGVGFVITNSMSGIAAFEMRAYVHVLACANGMILPRGHFMEDLRMVHRGGASPAGLMPPPSYEGKKFDQLSSHIADTIRKARSAEFAEYIGQNIERAKLDIIYHNNEDEEQDTFHRISNMLRLTQEERESYGEALLRPEHTPNRWGYVQAATWMAHQAPIVGTDRQEAIESAAWEVLTTEKYI